MKALRYKNYLLTLLLVILVFNTLDRVVLGLVLQDIKLELGLTDTQLGFLTGIAFALFYSLMGIPLARWADRGNRVQIIAITTALWSAAVALCGLAGSFVHLLLIRIGVAVGEAGCIPPAHSLIADYFERSERPRAIARYMIGIPLSYVIGYFVGGWLNELYGWRVTFFLLGVPGLGLAALALLYLREPRSAQPISSSLKVSSLRELPCDQPTVSSPVIEPALKDVCTTLWSNRTFRHLLLCWSVAAFFGYGVWQWKPAFFIRSYGMETGEVGTWFAGIYGIAGLLGTYCGGEWASRRAVHKERLQLQCVAAMYAVFAIISTCMYLAPNEYIALALMAIATLGIHTVYGPLFATIQALVPERMRAMAVAIIYLFANLVGMGLGPLAAGVLSDSFRSWAGDESLRYALLCLSPGYLWAAWHLWRGSKTVTRDLLVHSSEQPTTLQVPRLSQLSIGSVAREPEPACRGNDS